MKQFGDMKYIKHKPLIIPRYFLISADQFDFISKYGYEEGMLEWICLRKKQIINSKNTMPKKKTVKKTVKKAVKKGKKVVKAKKK